MTKIIWGRIASVFAFLSTTSLLNGCHIPSEKLEIKTPAATSRSAKVRATPSISRAPTTVALGSDNY